MSENIKATTKIELHHVDGSEYNTPNDVLYFIPIPNEIADSLGWKDNDKVDLQIEDGKIVLRKI